MATPSARAWSSAEVGEMKWTWQSTAIQSAPAGPATGSSGRTSGARPRRVAVDVERSRERAIAEPADHLDLHGPVRQLDREPARDVGVGRAAEDEVRAGVLVEARVDLVAMAERREVAPVGRLEPDAGRHRFAGRRIDDLDVDPTGRRPKGFDRHGAEPLAPAVGRQAARRNEILADGDRGVPGHREVDEPSRSVGPSIASGTPQPATALDCRPAALSGGGAGRSRNTCPRSTPRRRPRRRLDPQRPPRLEDQRRRGPTERRDRRDHDPATRVERRQRLHPQPGDVRRRRPGSRSRGATARCPRSGWAPNRPPRSGRDPSCPAGSRATRHARARRSHRPASPDTARASRAACRPGAPRRRTRPGPSR